MSVATLQSPEEINNSKSPISLEELKELFASEFKDGGDLQPTIQNVLKRIQDKSSKFKFVINLTKISSQEEEAASGVQVKNSIGFLWDESNDGSFNFIHPLSATSSVLVTFIWILIDEN